VVGSGDAEKVVLSRKSALRSALARLLVKKNVASADELLPSEVSNPGILFIQALWSTLLMKLNLVHMILSPSVLQCKIGEAQVGLLVNSVYYVKWSCLWSCFSD
jgi:hypothetical protein